MNSENLPELNCNNYCKLTYEPYINNFHYNSQLSLSNSSKFGPQSRVEKHKEKINGKEQNINSKKLISHNNNSLYNSEIKFNTINYESNENNSKQFNRITKMKRISNIRNKNKLNAIRKGSHRNNKSFDNYQSNKMNSLVFSRKHNLNNNFPPKTNIKDLISKSLKNEYSTDLTHQNDTRYPSYKIKSTRSNKLEPHSIATSPFNENQNSANKSIVLIEKTDYGLDDLKEYPYAKMKYYKRRILPNLLSQEKEDLKLSHEIDKQYKVMQEKATEDLQHFLSYQIIENKQKKEYEAKVKLMKDYLDDKRIEKERKEIHENYLKEISEKQNAINRIKFSSKSINSKIHELSNNNRTSLPQVNLQNILLKDKEINNSSQEPKIFQNNDPKFDEKEYCELLTKTDNLNCKTKDRKGNLLNVTFVRNKSKLPKEIPTINGIYKDSNMRNKYSFSTNIEDKELEVSGSLKNSTIKSTKKLDKINKNNLSKTILNSNSQELLLNVDQLNEISDDNLEPKITENIKEKEIKPIENQNVVYSLLKEDNENLLPFGKIIANNLQVLSKHKLDEKKNEIYKNYMPENNILGKPGFIFLNTLQKKYIKIH